MQSRNFRLQKVGDINWLLKNYRFQETSFSIDELIILDASRKNKLTTNFLKVIEKLAQGCFIPISVGGGIKSINNCRKLFDHGADKIVLNSLLTDNPDVSKKIIYYFGGQSVISSIDVKKEKSDYIPYKCNGSEKNCYANV
jgi:cyclase